MATVIAVRPRQVERMIGDRMHVLSGFDVPLPNGDGTNTTYKFLADPNNPDNQFCKCTREDHLAMFGAVPEAYQIDPDDKLTGKDAEDDKKKISTALKAGAKLRKERKQAEDKEQQRLANAALRRRKAASENRGKPDSGQRFDEALQAEDEAVEA